MPIRPERKQLYPANWKSEIVPMIRARSGDKCEICGVRNLQWVARTVSGRFFCYTFPGAGINAGAIVFNAEHGKTSSFAVSHLEWREPIKIILTVAHLNHDEADSRAENLAHLCQLHHNRHDAQHRAANAARTRKSGVRLSDGG